MSITLIVEWMDLDITDPEAPTILRQRGDNLYVLYLDPGIEDEIDFERTRTGHRQYIITKEVLAELCLYYQ